MKRFFLFLLISAVCSPFCFAVTNIDASDYENFDNMWAGQKVITNKEYEDTVNALEERKNKKEEKQKQKKLKKFKGESLHKELDATLEDLPDQTLKDPELEEQIVQLPVNIVVNDKLLERGYYRVEGEKSKEGVFLNLYQSHDLIAKIKAKETDDDFGEKDIMFAKILPYKDGIMKMIYGSIKLNAYTYIRYIEPEGSFISQ